MKKALGFLSLLAGLVFVSSSVVADDNDSKKIEIGGRVHQGRRAIGHATKTVVVRLPVAVLETSGDAARTAGNTVGVACDSAAGLWNRTGDRAFGLFRCRGR